MVNQKWLKQKLRNLKARRKWLRNMENKDVQVFVTGVSMTGEVKLDEHNRTPEEDKAKSKTEEIGDSREDD
jgi:hypothetical protein